jgi:hypothetical protein
MILICNMDFCNFSPTLSLTRGEIKRKGKVHPITGHEGPEVE